MVAAHREYPSVLHEVLTRLSTLQQELQDLRQWLEVAQEEENAFRSGPRLLQPPHDEAGAQAPAPGHWSLTCLGRFELRCAGHVVAPCSSRRGWSILQYLLVRPGFAALSDVLIETFWPEIDPEAGLHNLQAAIHSLRRSLRGCGPTGGDDPILFRAGQYLLHPDLSMMLDVDCFRSAYRRGQEATAAGHTSAALEAFEQARRYYVGPFLADNPYQEWSESPRAALQDIQLSVLGRLSTYYSQAGQAARSADCCRELLALVPYREDAYRELMRCQAALGQLADVHRTYRTCRDLLARDLQVDPEQETVLLYQSLVGHRS